MKTEFTEAQLQDAATRRSNAILRSCVHCGFCTATCPTYRVLGDECDSPRGRIYMIKNMLERGDPPDSKTVTHIDRCLSCLGCMTTCPSGVNYMHLVDHAREFIEDNFRRPVADRVIRWFLRKTLPRSAEVVHAAVSDQVSSCPPACPVRPAFSFPGTGPPSA